MSVGYACEKLDGAIRILAVNDVSLAKRLRDAWNSSLTNLSAHRMPWPDLDKRWETLRDQVEELDRLSADQLRSLALEIFELQGAAHRRANEGR